MWGREINGLVLTFHLAGINNQNFLMRDEQTGTYWQQISGRGISGPLAGQSLRLIPSDELTFKLWKSEQPDGIVLKDIPNLVELNLGGLNVTDANLVAGRLVAENFLGGAMRLYPARAAKAIAALGRAMHTSATGAARGVIRVVNANMERAVRVISVQRRNSRAAS